MKFVCPFFVRSIYCRKFCQKSLTFWQSNFTEFFPEFSKQKEIEYTIKFRPVSDVHRWKELLLLVVVVMRQLKFVSLPRKCVYHRHWWLKKAAINSIYTLPLAVSCATHRLQILVHLFTANFRKTCLFFVI